MTGVMTLDTSDYDKYDNFTIVGKITAEDEYSEVELPEVGLVYD